MISVIVIWALIGVGLGTYFSVFVLVPASALCLAIVAVVGVIETVDVWSIAVAMLVGTTMLHLGYLMGSLVHVLVSGHAEDRSDEQAMPHKLILGSDRPRGR